MLFVVNTLPLLWWKHKTRINSNCCPSPRGCGDAVDHITCFPELSQWSLGTAKPMWREAAMPRCESEGRSTCHQRCGGRVLGRFHTSGEKTRLRAAAGWRDETAAIWSQSFPSCRRNFIIRAGWNTRQWFGQRFKLNHLERRLRRKILLYWEPNFSLNSPRPIQYGTCIAPLLLFIGLLFIYLFICIFSRRLVVQSLVFHPNVCFHRLHVLYNP